MAGSAGSTALQRAPGTSPRRRGTDHHQARAAGCRRARHRRLPTPEVADARLQATPLGHSETDCFISVLTVGEILRGVERKRAAGDSPRADTLEVWAHDAIGGFADRVLPIDGAVVVQWSRLNPGRTLPAIDSLLAATALVHGLVMATRNVRYFDSLGVTVHNPFDTAP